MRSLSTELEPYIPLDKAWMIRMGMLDLRAGKTGVKNYLEAHTSELGDDLLALLRVLQVWGADTSLDVGESGTLYRFVRFLLWLQGSNQEITTQGTLKNRHLTDEPEIITWPIKRLCTLDGGTSQWASARVLFTDVRVPSSEKLPYHLRMSLDAKQAHAIGWYPRQDETILRQATAYYHWLQDGVPVFEPRQAEDFPFAVAFGGITAEEGVTRWPQLRNHETDRVQEMNRLLQDSVIDSPDHRVVQALAMRYPDRRVTDAAKQAVTKTWPQFWQFLTAANINK